MKILSKTKNIDYNLNRIEKSNTRSKNIQSTYRDRIWHRKMYHAKNEKREMTHDGQNRATKKIRTLGEKETYKYLGVYKLTPSNKWR